MDEVGLHVPHLRNLRARIPTFLPLPYRLSHLAIEAKDVQVCNGGHEQLQIRSSPSQTY